MFTRAKFVVKNSLSASIFEITLHTKIILWVHEKVFSTREIGLRPRSISKSLSPLRGDEFTARMYNLHARTTRKDIYDLLNYNNITIEFIEGTITNKAFITGDKEVIARITLDLDGCELDGNKIQVCNNLS